MLMNLATNLNLSFNEWFLLTRRKRNLSQSDIAEALGVSRQTVSNWEVGRSIPSLTIDQTKELCQVMGCSLADIPPVS